MHRIQTVRYYWHIVWSSWCLSQVASHYVKLLHDGPVVLGGTITFTSDLYTDDGNRPSGTFRYTWTDNSLMAHKYQTKETLNTTTYWSISYPREGNIPGKYIVQVGVERQFNNYLPFWVIYGSSRIEFEISEYLNGNITVEQGNKTIEGEYISSVNKTNLKISLRKGDYDYIMQNATTVTTYWFIDCQYFGQTNDLTFNFNFTNPDVTHEIGVLVIASFNSPATTTVSPLTTTTVHSNITTVAPNTTTNLSEIITPVTTTILPTTITSEELRIKSTTITSLTYMDTANMTLPYICTNASLVPPDPNDTYGYFHKKLNVRAPILNIAVDGTNWIQPWDMLSLNVTCKGSGPFFKCLQFHRGKYNMTGNETCDSGEHLSSCNFSIIHYFLEPSVYTILIILKNDISAQIYPLTINIYKVTTKPQLSVIVVPVSCTLVAVVLIVFGVAYYIQSRARFTVEVADFDFGRNNPEMEYKTFMERLRDSINNTRYKPLSNSQTLQ